MKKIVYNLFIKICSFPIQIAIIESDDSKISKCYECDIPENFIPSRDLISVIYRCLNCRSITLYDINNIYLLSGPGSYTACRIGATVSKLIYFITKKVTVFETNLLDLYMSFNRYILKKNQLSLNNAKNLISLTYAYNSKYFVAISNSKSSASYYILSIEQLKDLLTDDIYLINGKIKNKSQILQINRSNIEEKISYKLWYRNSTLVKDIDLYEPFYFDKDEENIN